MDIREAGTKSDFWIRAKIRLIDILLSSLKTKDARILDLGCGTGEDLPTLNRYGTVDVIDTDRKTLDMLPRHLYAEKRQGSAEKIDFPSNSFDIVAAFDVIEHVKDDKKAMIEIRRVLRDGGYFVFTVPAFQQFYSAHDKALGHYRRYNKPMLRQLFDGLEIKKLDYWNSSLFLPMSIFRIVRKGSDTADTSLNLPFITNELLYYVLCGEDLLAKTGLPMPFGLTIYGVCKKA